jgi:hypothetical protein
MFGNRARLASGLDALFDYVKTINTQSIRRPPTEVHCAYFGDVECHSELLLEETQGPGIISIYQIPQIFQWHRCCSFDCFIRDRT